MMVTPREQEQAVHGARGSPLPDSESCWIITMSDYQVEHITAIFQNGSTFRCIPALTTGIKKPHRHLLGAVFFGLRLQLAVAAAFAGRAHFLQILVDKEQRVAAGTDQRQLIQHGFEQFLFFMLLGDVPLQEIEG